MRRLAAGLGLIDYPFAAAASFWRWVDLCEAEGADSIWFSDRMSGPVPALECLAALAAVAGRTRRIKIGSNVLSLAMRDPVMVARQCATIDCLSGGRLLPAFGIGSAQESDWRGLGLDYAARGRRCDEALDILTRLWAGETLECQGSQFQFSGVSINPIPAQAELPIWIGGSSAAAIRRTARYGTGWQGGIETPEQSAAVIAAIRAETAKLNRHIDEDHYSTTIFFRFDAPGGASAQAALALINQRFGFDLGPALVTGDAADILARMAAHAAAGISKFILVPAAVDDADILHQSTRALRELAPATPGLL